MDSEPAHRRRLTPAQKHVSWLLWLSAPLAPKLEAYSNWLSAGAGAAATVLVGKVSLPDVKVDGQAVLFLALSLVPGAITRILGYIVEVSKYAHDQAMERLDQLWSQAADEQSFLALLEKAETESRGRLRIPASLLAGWARRRGAVDPLTNATIANAMAQYMVCSIFCQLLCIFNAAERLVIPLL